MAVENTNCTQTMLERLWRFQKEGAFCDLRLHGIDGSVHIAHACVLASISPVMHQHLQLMTTGNYSIHTSLANDSIQKLLSFAYTGQLDPADRHDPDFFTAANELGVIIPDSAFPLSVVGHDSHDANDEDLHFSYERKFCAKKGSRIEVKFEFPLPEKDVGVNRQYRACLVRPVPESNQISSLVHADNTNNDCVSFVHRIIEPSIEEINQTEVENLEIKQMIPHHKEAAESFLSREPPLSCEQEMENPTSQAPPMMLSTEKQIKEEPVNTATELECVCPYCEKLCRSTTELMAHEQTHMESISPHCIQCQITFSDAESLKAHKATEHSASQLHACPICGKGLASRDSLTQHIRTHKGVKPYQCDICERRFTQKAHMEGHRRTHTGDKPFKCKYCDKWFARRDGVVSHERCHTKETPFQCTLCDKRFPYRKSLQSHFRTHTGEKPHQCSFCDKSFAEKHHLVSHERTHTKETPYSCQYCDQVFAYRSTLVAHERTHTGELAFCCDVCGQHFSSRWRMKTHQKAAHSDIPPGIDTEAVPFHCSYCDAKFLEQLQLVTHEKIHTQRTFFSCQHCDKTFCEETELIQHEELH